MQQSLDQDAEDFTPRTKMVRWFSPRLLALVGAQAVVSEVFGSYADKRELERTLPGDHFDERPPDGDALWFDYVADLGDAYAPTSAMAKLIAEDALRVPSHGADPDAADDGMLTLPGGRFLVMGGDQVYPGPSQTRYQNQTIGPYAEALPADRAQRHLYLLPGNHDWYDGLTLFLRKFCQQRRFGSWVTRQHRSYFALQLSDDWWLCAADQQLDAEIDAAQLEYFKGLPLDGANVILCWARPVWAELPLASSVTRVLQAFEHDVLRPQGAIVRLYLAGDDHHYAHYVAPDAEEHRLTSGGGGAFLFPTHNLEPEVEVDADTGRRLQLTATYPDAAASRRKAWRGLLVGIDNPSFLQLCAGLHVLFAWAVQFGARSGDASFVQTLDDISYGQAWSGLVRNPVALFIGALWMAGWCAFAKPPGDRSSPRYRFGVGGPHGLAHVVLAFFVTVWSARVASWFLDAAEQDQSGWDQLFFIVSFLACVAVVGGALSGLLVGAYLLATNRWLRMHDNELFSAFHDEGFKHFLRMRIAPDGRLTVWAIGTDSTNPRKQRPHVIDDRIDITPIARPAPGPARDARA